MKLFKVEETISVSSWLFLFSPWLFGWIRYMCDFAVWSTCQHVPLICIHWIWTSKQGSQKQVNFRDSLASCVDAMNSPCSLQCFQLWYDAMVAGTASSFTQSQGQTISFCDSRPQSTCSLLWQKLWRLAVFLMTSGISSFKPPSLQQILRSHRENHRDSFHDVTQSNTNSALLSVAMFCR